MVSREKNEKMYYACGLCSTDSKVQWHRSGTKIWHEHKELLEEIFERSDSNLVKQYELCNILPQLAANHHSWNENTQLERIIGSADTVASATDRRYDIKAKYDGGIVTAQSLDKILPHQLNFDTEYIKCLDSPSTEILAINQSTSKSVEKISDETSIKLLKKLSVELIEVED